VLAIAAVSVADAADHHVTATLSPVNGSGISGTVELTALPNGTQIVVRAEGLTPGTQYVSLYYDNGTCELEPYSQEDVIEEYTANAAGRAVATGKADDDLDEISSVSVRLKSDFSLVACAAVTH
jgi:hypothetical protein